MRPLASLAAAALVGMVGLGVYRAFVAAPEVSAPALAESLGGAIPGLSELIKEDAMRGHSQAPDLDSIRDAFRLGVLDVDLYLSLTQKDESARDVCRRMANVLEDVPMMNPAVQLYRQCQGASLAAITPAMRERMAAELADGILSPFYLDFGRFTEAGRLAAVARRREFFERRRNQRVLVLLLTNPDRLAGEDEEIVLDPEVLALLEQVKPLWTGERSDPELGQIAKAMEAIIEHYRPPLSMGGFLAPPEVPLMGPLAAEEPRHDGTRLAPGEIPSG